MAKQIVVDLVADTSDFQKQMKKAADSVDGVEAKLKSTAKAQADLGDSFDESETKLMGAADLFDGLATTMGLPIDGAISMTRGFADMASGISTTLLPALATMNAKVLGTVRNMSKLKLGLGAVAIATAAVVASTDEGQEGFAYLNTKLNQAVTGLTRVGKNLLNLRNPLAQVTEGAWDAATALTAMNAAQDLINRGFGPDPLRPKNGGVSVDDLLKWRGAQDDGFGGTRWADDPNWEKAMNDNSKKGAKKTADSAAKAAKDAFAKYKNVLVDALKGWNEKLKDAKALAKTVKGLFTLDIGTARQDPFGLVHGLGVQAKNMKKFIDVIKKLRSMGFREGLIRQLVDQGPSALADAIELSHVSKKDVNELYDANNRQSSQFANSEAFIRTGVDVKNPKPVKVTLDIKGGDKAIRDMIKSWVRTDGGGNVQVAFGKR